MKEEKAMNTAKKVIIYANGPIYDAIADLLE